MNEPQSILHCVFRRMHAYAGLSITLRVYEYGSPFVGRATLVKREFARHFPFFLRVTIMDTEFHDEAERFNVVEDAIMMEQQILENLGRAELTPDTDGGLNGSLGGHI